MKNLETVKTTSHTVSCKGDDSSNHPLIYLQIAQDKNDVSCTYCGRKFVLSNK